jgi:hypothetical protein
MALLAGTHLDQGATILKGRLYILGYVYDILRMVLNTRGPLS